jgi:hypothetical protein
MMSAEEDLDLSAAGLRADGAELAVSVDVLASKLEQALPQIVAVERHKVGGFRSKRREVQRIALPLGEEQFELRRVAAGFQCTRHKVVRGITLSRQELSLTDWINEIVSGLARSAEVNQENRIALEGLLR